MTNPISVATGGKGRLAFIKRAWAISRRYGLTVTKLDHALSQFGQVLKDFDCSATFPITSVALKRNSQVIAKYQANGIEFAVHGYVHVDYTQLSLAQQIEHLRQARQVFEDKGIRFSGFRCPYLRWNADILQALKQQGFAYDSSQALYWKVVGHHTTPTYQRAIDFYRARPAADYVALPRLCGQLVRIPYSIPDDEAIVERLALNSTDEGSSFWRTILQRTHELGELFTLGLHPERIALCRQPLADTLAAARRLTPTVWIARLEQIAEWWVARSQASVRADPGADGYLHVEIQGPPGLSVLTRNLSASAPSQPWADGYQKIEGTTFRIRCSKRPFIGLAPDASQPLFSFLCQQGYVVERTPDPSEHTLYLDQTDLAEQDERALLVQLEQSTAPLLRLGRWPHGARSALAVGGDIDALTLWDYGLRFLGR